MSWRRLAVLVLHLPPESALVRELSGDMAPWDLKAQLLAIIANETRVANWMQTKDAQAGRNRPEPILPPWDVNGAPDFGGVGEITDNSPAGATKFHGSAMTIEETNDWLGW